jgi:hypothetical protein
LIGRTLTLWLCYLAAAGGLPLSVSARVDYERAVERTRYQFVIGNTTPFDEIYPRSIFEKRVARELGEERVLKDAFGLTVTPELLAQEFDRIEKSTHAPEQWEAIKATLKNDRRLIEEVFCRPLLVERALRAKFAFDRKIHAGPHQRAREARAEFLAGREPTGASVLVLARGARPPATEEILAEAQKAAALPRVLEPPRKRESNAPVPVEPELAAVVERELVKPGDVTTILEERDRFEVFRLLERTAGAWKVEAVTFPKVDFDTWFEKVRRSA